MAENWHAVERHVHRIAGTAQILGGASIVHLCETVELHLHTRAADALIYDAIDSLNKELNLLITAIDYFMISSKE